MASRSARADAAFGPQIPAYKDDDDDATDAASDAAIAYRVLDPRWPRMPEPRWPRRVKMAAKVDQLIDTRHYPARPLRWRSLGKARPRRFPCIEGTGVCGRTRRKSSAAIQSKIRGKNRGWIEGDPLASAARIEAGGRSRVPAQR